MRQERLVSGVLTALMMLAVVGASHTAPGATEQDQASTAIMMQGFHWNSWSYAPNWYGVLAGKAADMKDLGITHVWFPPPSNSHSNEGYLPRELNSLNSQYGAEADLVAATAALNAQGIKSVADIVINHRVSNTAVLYDFQNPVWGADAIVNNDDCACGTGGPDSGEGYGSARDIDHGNAGVQASLKTWMSTRLKADAGFTGIRYDYSKGYAPSYAKTYHDNWSPNFCVGEIWTDLDYNNVNAHRQLLMNYINGTDGTCAAFDFTTKGLLNKALTDSEYWRLKDSEGKPAGAIGWWPQKSVTFVDNHDTGPSGDCAVGQNHWPVPCGSVMQGYAYILTHPGIPTVYYLHVYDWALRASIKALIDVRKAAGITSTSAVSIQAAQTGLYAAIINGTAGPVAMKIGPNSWSPSGSGWTLATSGTNYAVWTGRPYNAQSLGARYDALAENVTFKVYSSQATRIDVYVFSNPMAEPEKAAFTMTLDAPSRVFSKTVSMADLRTAGVTGAVYYGYRAWGPNWPYDAGWTKGSSAGFISDVDSNGNRFNPNKLLLDPYALEMSHDPTTPSFTDGTIYASGPSYRNLDSGNWAPKGIVLEADGTSTGDKPTRALKDDIVYEVHVRGLTKGDTSIPEAYRGTYKGAALKAAYLKTLGVTAVEFLPLHETHNDTNDVSPSTTDGDNYWGYMTLNYFAPDRRYAYDTSPGGPTREFKEMVKAFHDQGLKVFVDVVYNHTGEGGAWNAGTDTYNIISFRGLDNPVYYTLTNDKLYSWDNTGCGGNYNTFNPVAQNLIVDSLAYWKDTLGVDGFRFDLASVLGNTCEHGCFNYDKMNSGTALNRIVRDIAPRPDGGGAGVDWIAEPWAIGGNSYQVGNFPSGWAEWNGYYRDVFRKDQNKLGSENVTPSQLSARFFGSSDLYGDDGRKPWHSINFMVAHDGFTLRDLYSFNSKVNNLLWPYGPSDGGEDNNNSWEQSGDAAAQRKAARNGLAFLLLSAGTPMITGGDEFFRTQYGNNNAYNLDAYTNWLDYGIDTTRQNFKTFAERLIAFRNAHPALRPANFYSSVDNNANYMEQHRWFDSSGNPPPSSGYWDNAGQHAIAYRIDGTEFGDTANAIYVAYNGWSGSVDFYLPWPGTSMTWARVLETAEWAEGPNQAVATGSETYIGGEWTKYVMNPRSLAVFIAKNTCAAPTGLSATPNGEGRIDLAWTGSASSFNVLRSAGGGAYFLLATVAATSYSDTTAQGGVNYSYMVQAAGGCTSPNSTAAAATALGCGFAGISGVSQLAGGSCGYKVSWASATGSCSTRAVYNIYRSTTSGFSPSASNRIAACVVGTSYQDSQGLSSNTTYYYRVRAENQSVWGSGPCGGTEDANSIVLDTYAIPIKCVPSGGNPSPVQYFNVTSGNGTNVLQWVNPATAPVSPFQVRIQSRTDGSYPANPADGSKETEVGGQTVSAKGSASLTGTNGTEFRYGIFTDNNAGTVYSAGRFSKGTPFSTSGPVKWKYSSGATALTQPGLNILAGGNSALVVSNDRVLHALAAASGEWPATFTPRAMNAPSQAQPMVLSSMSDMTPGHERVVFVAGQDGRVYARNANTGAAVWDSGETPLAEAFQGGVTAILSRYGASVNRLFVTTRTTSGENKLLALDPKTTPDSTRVVWTFGTGRGIGISNSSAWPEYGSEKVYFTSRKGAAAASVWCANVSDGALCSGFTPPDLGDIDSTPVLLGGYLYVGNNNGTVYRVNPASGAASSLYSSADGPVKGFVWPDTANARVLFTTTNKVWCVSIQTGSEGTLLWAKDLTGRSPAPPFLWNGRVYIGLGDGKLLQMNAADSTNPVELSVEEGAALGTPGIDATTSRVFIGSESGTVHSVAIPLP